MAAITLTLSPEDVGMGLAGDHIQRLVVEMSQSRQSPDALFETLAGSQQAQSSLFAAWRHPARTIAQQNLGNHRDASTRS